MTKQDNTAMTELLDTFHNALVMLETETNPELEPGDEIDKVFANAIQAIQQHTEAAAKHAIFHYRAEILSENLDSNFKTYDHDGIAAMVIGGDE